MAKTALDVRNENIKKQLKTREKNVKYMSNPENREKWNVYQAQYARTRRQTDPLYARRLREANQRYYQEKKAQLV